MFAESKTDKNRGADTYQDNRPPLTEADYKGQAYQEKDYTRDKLAVAEWPVSGTPVMDQSINNEDHSQTNEQIMPPLVSAVPALLPGKEDDAQHYQQQSPEQAAEGQRELDESLGCSARKC